MKSLSKKINIQDEIIHVDATKIDYSEQFEGFKDFHKIVGPNETDSRLDKAVIELKGIKEELKVVVTALKETSQSIQGLSNKMDQMNETMNQAHNELIGEIRGLREDNNEKVLNETHEVKTLLKIHLKQP